jgi:hypothetical protein
VEPERFGHCLRKAMLAAGYALGADGLVIVANKPQQRLKKLAEQLGDRTDQRIEKMITGISGFKRKYLKALNVYFYQLKVEGFTGNLPTIPLKQVYIPLRIQLDGQSLKSIFGACCPSMMTSKTIIDLQLLAIAFSRRMNLLLNITLRLTRF